MAGSPYASALGRLKPDLASFLPKETYATLLAAKDVNDLAKLLEGTVYADDIGRERAPRYIRGMPLVSDYLDEALAQFGLSLEDYMAGSPPSSLAEAE